MRPVPPSVVGLEFRMDDWAGSDLRNSWVSESADSWQVTYLLAWGGLGLLGLSCSCFFGWCHTDD